MATSAPPVQNLDRSLAALEAWIAEEEQAAKRQGVPLNPFLLEMRRHSKPLRTAWNGWQLRQQRELMTQA